MFKKQQNSKTAMKLVVNGCDNRFDNQYQSKDSTLLLLLLF